MNITIGDALRNAVHCLEMHGVAEARPAAEVLLAELLSLTRPRLYLDARRPLSAVQHSLYTTHIQRRLQGEPVQYITGHQEFWSLEFEVSPQVLIPRPESELLVEHGIYVVCQWCATHQQATPLLLDVGTGSGNLAISLATALPQSWVWGSDVALSALRVAQANARRLSVADRLRWVCGDLVTPFRVNGRCFALCVANLPYVSVSEWQQLPREIRDHEPRGALVGGADGLDLIRRLVVTSPGVLAPGGMLLLEVGQGQAPAVIDLMRRSKQFQATGILQDFAGIARVVWGYVR